MSDLKQFREAIGRAIRAERARADITQEELAARCGWGADKQATIEAGIVRIDDLYKIAGVIGCTLTDLVPVLREGPYDEPRRLSPSVRDPDGMFRRQTTRKKVKR